MEDAFLIDSSWRTPQNSIQLEWCITKKPLPQSVRGLPRAHRGKTSSERLSLDSLCTFKLSTPWGRTPTIQCDCSYLPNTNRESVMNKTRHVAWPRIPQKNGGSVPFISTNLHCKAATDATIQQHSHYRGQIDCTLSIQYDDSPMMWRFSSASNEPW